MALSELACRHAKPKDRPYKLTDGEGLFLLVNKNGSRLWRMAYRFGGKQKTLSFGAYPTVTLAEVRELHLAARRVLAKGEDPGVKRKEIREGQGAPTFEAIATEWLAGMSNVWSPGHMLRVKSRFVEDIFPEIGSLPITEIKAATVLAMLRKIEQRGALDAAKRVRQMTSKVFRFAIATSRAEIDPASFLINAMTPSPRTKHHAALKERDLPEFLTKLAAYDGDVLTKLALDFTLSTFVRSNETRWAAWSEIEGLTGPAPVWRIPAERMKMHREHLVPLSPRAVAILTKARKVAADLGVKSDLVFPGRSRTGALSSNTMIFGMYRMGYHSKATVHGMRSTASTILNENGFNRDWIEMQLAHVEGDDVRGAYNSAEWLKQRTEMMLWWGRYLDRQAEMADLLS